MIQRNWKTLITVLALGIFAVLIAACGDVSTSDPIDLQGLQNVDLPSGDLDMEETIERLQQIAPEYQRQLQQMDKLGIEGNCSSAYPEGCIPPPPPFLKCKDVGQKNFLVLPPDPHHFDPDGNGLGCEE